jgi:amidase
LEANLQGKRIAWVRDFKGHTPCDPEVLDVCTKAVRTFESLGCVVEEAVPDFDLDAVWQAVIRLRGWQQGGAILKYYNDPATRALLKPEAIYEVEVGLKQSAYDISAASGVRTAWYHAVRRFFERYDFFVVPTAQVFP